MRSLSHKSDALTTTPPSQPGTVTRTGHRTSFSVYRTERLRRLTVVTLLQTATGLFTAKSRSNSKPRHRSLKSLAFKLDNITDMSAVAVAEATRPLLRSRLQRSPTADAGAELQCIFTCRIFIFIYSNILIYSNKNNNYYYYSNNNYKTTITTITM